MARQNIKFGILILLGFALISILYFVVMSGTPQIQGKVMVGSSIVSRAENLLGMEDTEMVAVNGYRVKGPNAENRLLLSTRNKYKSGILSYSFTAKEGMRHFIVVYLQLDYLTGELGQTLELHFLTNMIEKDDLRRDFIITFQETNDINMIGITVAESNDKTPKVFEYPVTEIPDIIKI
jgi:hypothetical protein